MITLLGSLLGLFGSVFPDILKLFRDRADRAHELAILDRQMELQKLGLSQRLEEIGIQADAAEAQALYATFRSGVEWVDALGGTVRPVLAYAFFLLYAAAKFLTFAHLPAPESTPVFLLYETLWSGEDQAIFAGIISFYFGQRAMSKLRGGK